MPHWKLYKSIAALAATVLLCLPVQALAFDLPTTLPEELKNQDEDVAPYGEAVCDAPLYAGPEEDAEKTGSVRAGEMLEVYAVNVNGDWDAVALDGVMSYIKSDCVSITAPSYVYDYLPNVTKLTGFSGGQLELYLKGGGLEGLGDTYARMETEYGVNALFLICINKFESANGTSYLAKTQNNLGGIKDGKGWYLSFPSKAACVEHLAKMLRNNYISEDGRYHRGKTSQAISFYYCEQSESWYQSVESLMRKGYELIASAT